MTGRREAVLAAALVALCATGAWAQPPASSAPPRKERVLPQGFSVILVLADLQATSGGNDVPPAAQRALADMKDFLPYKSYKLLDAAWILGSGSTSTTRLRGAEEQEYELRLQAAPMSSAESRVSVRFALSAPHGVDHPGLTPKPSEEDVAASIATEQEIAALSASLAEARQRRDTKQVAEVEGRINDLRRRTRRNTNRTVMDTNFVMDVGETVVVGTSRLRGGGKALIALLTAVPPRGMTSAKE